MATTELRPLSLGELLDRTFTYYRSHFWLFVGIMAIPQLFLLVLHVLTVALQAPAGPGGAGSVFLTVAAILGLLVTFVAYLIAYTAALGATTYALSEVYLGHPASIRSAYRRMHGRVWPLIKLSVSMTLRVVSPLLLIGVLITVAPIPGTLGLPVSPNGRITAAALAVVFVLGAFPLMIWLMVRYGVAIPVLVLENTTVSEAIRRSVSLTRGYRGRIFLIGVLVATVTAVLAVVLEAPFLVAAVVASSRARQLAFWANYGAAFARSASGALSGPLLMLGLALAYYDIRVRKEGFDLQVMMASLGPAPQPAVPAVAVPPATS